MINRLPLCARLMGATALTLVAATAHGQSNEGFSLRLNGADIASDTALSTIARRADVALADADIQVVVDGLGVVPRLDLEVIGDAAPYTTGDVVTLQSALNYPAYINRAEMRVIDLAAVGGPRTVAVAPITPNGQVSLTLPAGEDFAIVHRVYDAQGRFDETFPLSLTTPDDRTLSADAEDGSDATAERNIPVHGGAVTVRGQGVVPGGRVTAFGGPVTPDRDGGFILQRILPAGAHDIDIAVNGSGQRVNLTRRVVVPASEWFYTGTADVTFGVRTGDDVDGTETYQTGRVAGYVDGRTQTGVAVTASIDTGEGPLEDIFRDLDEKDPRSVLLRVDPDDLYPTYGDDSTSVDNTPTSGKIYLRVARDDDFVLWGDFTSTLTGNALVRNERTLYGLQGHVATNTRTTAGIPRAAADLYAAQPDKLPQRDVFRGTDGSVYFLEKQDIGGGSETISIQVRDPGTDRVIETVTLAAGRDYDINYIQGIVTLRQPLQNSISPGVVIAAPGEASNVNLVVQYEYTPTATDLDGFSYGGRVEGWATDQLRVGVSGIVEQTGIADQTLAGVDVLYQLGETSFIRGDVAQSEGLGFGTTFSANGGLIFDETAATDGNGTATKIEAQIAFADIGLQTEGAFSAYAEQRSEGFSNLDNTVSATTGDEDLWGFAIAGKPNDVLSYRAYLDSYENAAGDVDRTAGAELGYQISDPLLLEFGLESTDRDDATETGQRTDAAVRLTYAFSDAFEASVFGQETLDVDGLDRNDRYGIGADYRFTENWRISGEVSDGNLGTGGSIRLSNEDDVGNQTYFGYTLEPGRTLAGVTLNGTDRGRFVAGGTRKIGADVTAFGENTYDVFGAYNSLASSYGLTYQPTDTLQYSAAMTVATVQDDDENDFERQAVSFGLSYDTEQFTSAGRVEYRTEEGLVSGNELNTDTLLISLDARYKIDETQRIVGSLDLARTQTDASAILDGEYTDAVLGYAFRPIDNEQLNILARYRYLEDLYGQRVDDADEDGPRQRSQVVSVDAIYDLNERWSIGGKVGYRASETAATEASAFTQNDAWLAVGGVTYHMLDRWDIAAEVRNLTAVQAETSDTGVLATVYRHVGDHLKIGGGYNFGQFSDDLTDLVQDDQGLFINLVAKY
ncbi:TonB-dependent receptor [Roseobacter sp. CCS2]|uniref:TonB-dependent receptor n=1 Tax=Roseobacter sp. CCS2 TaxID=391593 RepID=UPI0000F3E0BF|nr:TonB-dependent receptor [Roseobacter sp. CCS2]EBA11991.1 hypothetical protein RCCS2_11879 [Roseobacter sp. CCS2]